MISVLMGKKSLALLAAVFISALTMTGCATAIKYSYDTKANLSEGKTYTWAQSSAIYQRDPLLETNVQALTDQLLGQKGFSGKPEKADLMISISYEFDSSSYPYSSQYSYQLRLLNLNIYRISMNKENAIENKELVWRGTAFGTISTDAASGDLKEAVRGILSNFPPK
jgi:hypothetical protein